MDKQALSWDITALSDNFPEAGHSYTEFEVHSTRYMICARLLGTKNSMGKVDIYSLLWLQSGWVQDTEDCFKSE